MKGKAQREIGTRKRRVIKILAVFFVLYALADVTVLQQYCGNEMVGIPSYAEQVRAEKRRTEATDNTQKAFINSDLFPQEQMPGSPESEDSCFCCCSHILLGFSPLKLYTPILVTKESASNFSPSHQHSSTHLRLDYQPPKFA